MPETTIHLILQTPERRSDTVMDIHISTTPIFRWPGIHIHTSLKRKRKVSGLSLLFIQAVSPSLCLSFFGEDICLRQGWASLETWRPLALSATVAMERSRNGADKSWMRKLMFQRGPRVGGVSGTTLVTNVKLFWCMTETENWRAIRMKKRGGYHSSIRVGGLSFLHLCSFVQWYSSVRRRFLSGTLLK